MPTREEILQHQHDIKKSIYDSFSKGGRYMDNAENRRLHRVGMPYGKGSMAFKEGEIKSTAKKEGRDNMSPKQLVNEAFSPEGKFYKKDTMGILSRGDRYTADFTPNRKKLHDKILKGVIGNAKPVEDKVGYIMGGATANGKSSIIDSGFLSMPDNMVKVDSDQIKGELPEYQHMVTNKDHNDHAAAFVHEESSYLAKRALYSGVEMGTNVLLDGTGDTSVDSVMKKIKRLKEKGYRVVAHYCTLDTELSYKLAEARAKKTGRIVPKFIIEKTNKGVATVLPQLIAMNAFDEVTLWDTNQKGNPRKILEMKDGTLDMHNKDLYKNFLKKENG